jgi:hypothetical protein
MKGYVYLLHKASGDIESYKIGISKNDPEKRVKQLQTGNDSSISLLRQYESENYKKVERMLHKQYHKYSTESNNEWFNLPDVEVISFIENCKKVDELVSYMKENNPFF